MEPEIKHHDIKPFHGGVVNVSVKDGRIHAVRNPIDRWMIGITWATIKRQSKKRGYAIY